VERPRTNRNTQWWGAKPVQLGSKLAQGHAFYGAVCASANVFCVKRGFEPETQARQRCFGVVVPRCAVIRSVCGPWAATASLRWIKVRRKRGFSNSAY